MGIMEKVFGRQQAATPAPAAAQANNGTQAAAGTKPQPVAGEGGSGQLEHAQNANGGSGDVGTSPLAPFADLFKDTATAEPGTTPGKSQPGNTNTGPKKPNFAEISKNLKFSAQIPAQLKAKAQTGDAEAFDAILDHVGRMAFASSGSLAEQLFARGSQDLETRLSESLPKKFRELSLSNTPVKHPVLSRPEVKPMVESIRLKMAEVYPDATTEELQSKAEDYFLAINKEIAGHDAKTKQAEDQNPSNLRAQELEQQQAGTFDWDEKFGLSSN